MGSDVPTSDGRVADAEAKLAALDPGYLTRVRAAAQRLGVPETATTDSGAALAAVEELATIDLDVPTASRVPVARTVKKGIKRVLTWYLGYFARQLAALGYAMANLGEILLERTDRLDREVADLRHQVTRLSEQVETLSRGLGSSS